MKTKSKHIVIILAIILTASNGFAQFYNGYQMRFGKNRVQYDIFEWQYYRFKKFDTYFYADGSELAKFTCDVAEKKIKEFERFFEYPITQRLIFQVYNNLSDFRQSNIGLISGSEENNIGGTTTISQNRAFLYFEGDYKKFEEQISAAIVEMIVNQMLYGGSLTSKVANSTLLSLPEWYTKGLIRYMSQGWNSELEDITRDAVLSGKYDNFNRLMGEEAIMAGHSVWHYIAKRYGKAVIPNIVYLARISKSAESGFMFVLGTPFKFLSYEWVSFYYDQYAENEKGRTIPEPDEEILKTKKRRVYQQLTYQENSKRLAFTTNEIGRYIIWIYDTETGKKKSILRKEHRLQQITDYSYPLLAWFPKGDKLTFIIEDKGGIWFNIYDLETKKTEKRQIFKFSKILDYEFSPDGKYFVFTGVKDGQVDIFTYSLLANTHKHVTNDRAEDKQPSFLKNGTSIAFASNRVSDSLVANSINENYDLFVFEKNADKLKRLTNTPHVDDSKVKNLDNLSFLYLNNENGIQNLALAKYDSAISFIDTVVHYKYFAKNYALTDYKRNILDYSYDANNSSINTLLHYNKKDRLFSSEMSVSEKANIPTRIHTPWKKSAQKVRMLDSLEQLKVDTISIPELEEGALSDTSFIDYRNYQFDVKSIDESELNVSKDTTRQDKSKERRFRPIYYFTSFYKNNMVTQVDFGSLNQSYQAFTGSAVYYNPGLNVYTKLGVTDLFQDHKFTAGAKLGIDFNSTEYLFSLENVKNRLDKEYVFHRKAFEESGVVDFKEVFRKTYTHQFHYILKYPFSQVSALKGTLTYRNDRSVFKSTSQLTLEVDDQVKNWAGAKLEYIFDNSLSLGLNLYQGWKSKIFAEAYKQIDGDHPDLYVLGFDFRHYQRIHRTWIWASRLAGSTSLGENRLMYYLGSTDNWMNFSRSTPTFDESVKRNQEINWAFQALATNMRGFPQNVRNGNTFVVMNNELRFPVVKYFSRAPITSDFLYNLQLITFFDIGTAWTGKSPYDSANMYNQDDYDEGPITIIVDNQKAPFVYGYGGGVRSKLLGYFIRADVAWGIDGDVVLPRIFYLSLSLDF